MAAEGAMVIVHFGRNSEAAAGMVTAITSRGGAAFALRLIWHMLKTSSASFLALDEQLTMQTVRCAV